MENISLVDKSNLTLKEAAQVYNIGIHNLRKLCDADNDFVLWVGNKRLIKKKQFEMYLESVSQI